MFLIFFCKRQHVSIGYACHLELFVDNSGISCKKNISSRFIFQIVMWDLLHCPIEWCFLTWIHLFIGDFLTGYSLHNNTHFSDYSFLIVKQYIINIYSQNRLTLPIRYLIQWLGCFFSLMRCGWRCNKQRNCLSFRSDSERLLSWSISGHTLEDFIWV